MAIPPARDELPEEPRLVEPRGTTPRVDLGQLDTARILTDTGAIDSPDFPAAKGSGPTEASSDLQQEPAPRRARHNVLSLISLVLALTLSPFAVLFGYLAVGQIRRGKQSGEAIAWWAVGLGWLWLAGYVILGSVLALTWWEIR